MAVAGPTVTERDVEDAATLLEGRVRETPMLPAGELSRHVGARTLLKAENLQLTGSFKVRGALNTIARLSPDELDCGVVAASAGNHAQAVAWAARGAGARAKLVMPSTAPLAKVAAVRDYEGEVKLVEGSYDAAGEEAARVAEEEGRTLIHAFDQASIVAGQGTVGLEIGRQDPDVGLVVVPVGGGGLSSGIAVALAGRARIVGVQAEERAGATICDGIAIKRPGAFTGPLVERFLDELVTVSDDEVAEAMVLLLERSKQVVEPAGAVGVAALLHGRIAAPASGSVCAVLSGGNVDASLLSECIRLGETAAGRRMVIGTVIPDRPGALAGLLRLVAEHGANVVDVEHLRDGIDLHVRETAIKLVLQIRGPDNGREIVEAARAEGFAVAVEREVV
ncbi:MAG TPA: pyridoxal-phosphate dependent enzyme [Thermoleophilaceae bacterium]|jgi:threonine dehydratase